MGTVVVDQKTYPLTGGMIFFFRPFQLHKIYVEVSSDAPYERSTFHFDQEVLSSYLTHFPTYRDLLLHLQYGVNGQQVFEMKEQLTYITQASTAFNKNLKHSTTTGTEQAAIFLLQILTCLNNSFRTELSRANHPPRLLSDTDNYTQRAMLWIEQHYMFPFELDQLAQQIHVSKSHLSRLFHKDTGSSITTYLTARRMQQACYLLQSTHLPTDQIGEKVGLLNVSYFIQTFKKTMGITPHQYRLQLNRAADKK